MGAWRRQDEMSKLMRYIRDLNSSSLKPKKW